MHSTLGIGLLRYTLFHISFAFKVVSKVQLPEWLCIGHINYALDPIFLQLDGYYGKPRGFYMNSSG